MGIQLDTNSIHYLLDTCRMAAGAILEVYGSEFAVERKADTSPVTAADMAAHRVILKRLRKKWPEIPILSEESAGEAPYEVRREWSRYWLVDPLDGTKEFIKRNGQFTVNIALIEQNRPMAGIVYAPVTGRCYFGHGDVMLLGDDRLEPAGEALGQRDNSGVLRVVGSLSHRSPAMDAWLDEQRKKYGEVEFVPMGSSLKICLVAEGRADVYPRFGPTMEWDTAAAHAVANAAGRKVWRWGSDEELAYNKQSLKNPWFIVS